MNELLRELNPTEYSLELSDFLNLDERTIVVTKWNWDYKEAHRFQRQALELVQKTPHLRILICCSHPEVLTNGRGLQKPRKGEVFDLVEFKQEEHASLPYSLVQVERGGGLTFHHPGQFIFYPIVKLNPKSLSLSSMIDQIFDFSIDVLKSWGIDGLHHNNKLLGLWHRERKLASMGIAIEKLTTFHGMALNLSRNEEMILALKALNPCGLRAETYISVQELLSLPEKAHDIFREQFLKRIQDEWK
jgi:lipoate-protein ligase B